jgi:hypothetical protein
MPQNLRLLCALLVLLADYTETEVKIPSEEDFARALVYFNNPRAILSHQIYQDNEVGAQMQQRKVNTDPLSPDCVFVGCLEGADQALPQEPLGLGRGAGVTSS